MRAAYEVTFICYSPFSLDIFPRNVQNKPIKFKQFQEKLYHETGVFTLKGTGKLELEDTFRPGCPTQGKGAVGILAGKCIVKTVFRGQ